MRDDRLPRGKTIDLTCIICPVGCTLHVSSSPAGVSVLGNRCSKGAEYGAKEITHPERFLQSTVLLLGSATERRLPVKTDGPVPKDKLFDVLKEIKKVHVHVPVNMGDVIIKNVLGLGVNVVATRTIEN